MQYINPRPAAFLWDVVDAKAKPGDAMHPAYKAERALEDQVHGNGGEMSHR